MVPSGYVSLLQRSLAVLIFKVVRMIFNCVQSVFWHLTGTARKVADTKKPENYDRCAQIVNITWMCKFELFAIITLKNFIYTHNRFVSPRYIFDNDDVTLLTISDEFAVFSESREKGARLWLSKYNAFMRLAQLEHSNKLILVPRNAFHRMSEERGDISENLIFLFHTMRCGSTLLTQMLERTGQCVAISEPDVSKVLAVAYKAKGSTPETEQLMRDAFRWVCRPYKDFKPLTYFVKLTSQAGCAIPIFKKTFPQSKCMFMYREPLQVVKSMQKLRNRFPMWNLSNFKIIGNLMDILEYPGKDFMIKSEDSYTFDICIFISIVCKFYLELQSEGFAMVAVRYEDIIRDPTFACGRIFAHIGMPENLVALAVKALEQDSHCNGPLSMKLLGENRDSDMTPKSKELANRLLRKYGLPILGEDLLLPGTITAP